MGRQSFNLAYIGQTPEVLDRFLAGAEALEGTLEPRQADVLEAVEEFRDRILGILGAEQARVKLIVWSSAYAGRESLQFEFGLERDRRL